MSAQPAGAERPQREFWPRAGHHAWKAPLLVNAVLIGSYLVPGAQDWFWGYVVFVFAVFSTATYATARHNHALCERCISEMPLNPQALILRRDRQLQWNHKEDGWSRRKRVLILVLLLAALIGITFLPHWLTAVCVALWFGVFQTYDILATRTHKILQPWCPYCRRRRPMDDQFSPDPVPLPTEKADR